MKYKIEFFDYWHLSSGMSAGSTLDSLVVKTRDELPYVPGKTIKGLLREMVEVLDKDKVKDIFGDEGKEMSSSYFSNVTLNDKTIKHLIDNPTLIKNLYSKITSTKIDKKGVADDKSLRSIEVVVPLTLYGYVECKNEDTLKKAMAMIKQIGSNRNRGLGRCMIDVIKELP